MQELLNSKRFRSSWALLSRTELNVADRAAAINGVMRILGTENLTLQDLLEAACRGSARIPVEAAGTRPAEPASARRDTGFKPGFEHIKVNIEPSPNMGGDQARAQHAYSRMKTVGGEDVPNLLIGMVRIDDALSNPRAAYGVIILSSDTDVEWGPLRVYGTDLDTARHARDHQIRVEGRVMQPSSPRHMPILTELRAVA